MLGYKYKRTAYDAMNTHSSDISWTIRDRTGAQELIERDSHDGHNRHLLCSQMPLTATTRCGLL